MGGGLESAGTGAEQWVSAVQTTTIPARGLTFFFRRVLIEYYRSVRETITTAMPHMYATSMCAAVYRLKNKSRTSPRSDREKKKKKRFSSRSPAVHVRLPGVHKRLRQQRKNKARRVH